MRIYVWLVYRSNGQCRSFAAKALCPLTLPCSFISIAVLSMRNNSSRPQAPWLQKVADSRRHQPQTPSVSWTSCLLISTLLGHIQIARQAGERLPSMPILLPSRFIMLRFIFLLRICSLGWLFGAEGVGIPSWRWPGCIVGDFVPCQVTSGKTLGQMLAECIRCFSGGEESQLPHSLSSPTPLASGSLDLRAQVCRSSIQ